MFFFQGAGLPVNQSCWSVFILFISCISRYKSSINYHIALDTGVIIVYLKQGAGKVITLLLLSLHNQTQSSRQQQLPYDCQIFSSFWQGRLQVWTVNTAVRGEREVSFLSRATCLRSEFSHYFALSIVFPPWSLQNRNIYGGENDWF